MSDDGPLKKWRADRSHEPPKQYVCSSGKTDHPSRQSANEQLVSLKRAGHGDNMHAYQCRECGRWHVGHIPGSRSGLRKRENNRKDNDNG